MFAIGLVIAFTRLILIPVILQFTVSAFGKIHNSPLLEVLFSAVSLGRQLSCHKSLYCLPPHNTNILQSLDVSVYRPLKTKFSNITDLIKLASLTTTHPITVSKKNFTPLFKDYFYCRNDRQTPLNSLF